MFRRTPKTVWLLLILLALSYTSLSVLRHMRYESGGFDLGLFDQIVWKYSRFMVPYSTLKERLILGDHLTLTLPLLAPLYLLWDDVRVLLVFQAFWLMFSAVAIYLIARKRGMDSFRATIITGLYALFPGTQYSVLFDFHAVIIGVGLLPWIAYAVENRNYRAAWIMAGLFVLTQENMGFALAGLGCIYFLRKEHRQFALRAVVAGIVSSIIAIRVTAWLSPIGFEYRTVLPDSFAGFITQLFDHPDKRASWMMALGWFAFLSVLSPGALAAIVMDFAQYFITGPAVLRMWSPFTHHRAMLAVFLVLGSIDVLVWLKKRRIRYGIIIIAIACIALVQQYRMHYPLNNLTKAAYWRREQWMRDNDALISRVPRNAALAVQQNIAPHVTHRSRVYLAWPRAYVSTDTRCHVSDVSETDECWWLDFPEDPQYLIVDTRSGQWYTQTLETSEHFIAALTTMEKRGYITPVESVGAARMYSVHQSVLLSGEDR